MELTVSTALKKKLVAAFLVALFAWPAVQHALVLRYHINPWWLFGMAMYCEIHRVQRDKGARRRGYIAITIARAAVTKAGSRALVADAVESTLWEVAKVVLDGGTSRRGMDTDSRTSGL